MTRLTQHFALSEFLYSETAARMGRDIVAPPDIEANLKRLCVELLEPVRCRLARPIIITSGYRPPWLNTAIGGSPTSAHMSGFAADIKVVGMSPDVFCGWFQDNAEREGWKFDQCILEFNQWTHLGLQSAAGQRNQYLTAAHIAGGTVYRSGIAG